jgi:hypothetical protein
MTESSDADQAFRVNTRALIVGGVLMGVAGLIGVAGLAVAGAALGAAARDWANRQEVPPSEMARQHWLRAKAATAAGTSAWRNGTQQQVTSS